MTTASLPGFHRLPLHRRRRVLAEHCPATEGELETFATGGLELTHAALMIENAIGMFALPLGIGTNMRVNGREYLVPMVVEEPSIVAGISAAAKLARAGGGFTARSTESLLIGQIQLRGAHDAEEAAARLRQGFPELCRAAGALQPRLYARGGGLREAELHPIIGPSTGEPMLIVHLYVDTVDAMGANCVNSLCEGLTPLVEQLCGGEALLRILSNLTDRSVVTAEVRLPAEALAAASYPGEEVCRRIVAASEFAEADPYRAATHNKGIMNGIDAVAVATGNDWRSLEAGAHAYAARSGSYRALSRWRFLPVTRELHGRIELPLKVGIVGAQVEGHPAVKVAQRILSVSTAVELAELMAAVGLAQNFAALRALVTTGISAGHLTLHARAVAAAAETPPDLVDEVVNALIASGEIKVWKARALIKELRPPTAAAA